MISVSYEYNGEKISGDAKGYAAGMFCLISEGCCFSLSNVTKYNGLISPDGEQMLRSVENIFLSGQKPDSFRITQEMVERHSGDAIETFRLKGSKLQYDISGYQGEVIIDLDMRRISDSSSEGRRYSVEEDEDKLVVTHEKYRDSAFAVKEYESVLIIKGFAPGSFRKIGEWQERHYDYDGRRGDSSTCWVYRLGAFLSERSINLTFVSRDEIPPREVKSTSNDALPAAIVLSSLESLTTGEEAILAGMPWFARQWSRDELVCVGAFIKAGRYELAKHVIMRYVALLDKAKLDAFYPSGGLSAADALGWLAKRLHELLLVLEEKKLLKEHFSRKELAALHARLNGPLSMLAQKNPGLIANDHLETWMDTAEGDDDRSGYRIEIQALQLAAYKCLHYLEKKTTFFTGKEIVRRETALAQLVRKEFFIADRLADGIKDGARDDAVRPNIFLAYYLYPELLTPQQWKSAFDFALTKLWLPWGGLASIDTTHPLFCAHYTGMNNKSYHRGDSWYWINAVAAIALRRLDSTRYKEQIKQITDACIDDMLFQGALGHCSEISSATEQSWGGCFAQAWSAAMLYELLKE